MVDYSTLTDRELDALVAERVMEWQSTVVRPSHWRKCHTLVNTLTGKRVEPYQGPWFIPPTMTWDESPENGVELPPYSTDIAAAWSVVEKMREHGHFYRLSDTDGGCTAVFGDIGNWFRECRTTNPPRAICIAALIALDAQESTNGS